MIEEDMLDTFEEEAVKLEALMKKRFGEDIELFFNKEYSIFYRKGNESILRNVLSEILTGRFFDGGIANYLMGVECSIKAMSSWFQFHWIDLEIAEYNSAISKSKFSKIELGKS